VIEHVDEEGKPCTRHPISMDKLLPYATVGTRISGFHHDAASKLQSLVMALDEISELIGEENSDVRTATETAQTAVRQLHALLSANRALAKGPQPARTPLPELMKRAAERHAVKLRGEVPSLEVMAAAPSMTHAFSLLFDMIAGPPAQGRAVEITTASNGDRITLTLSGNAEATHPSANELIGVATYMFGREDGTLRCGPKRFVIELALAQPSGFVRT
jgi:hypothetical protein